MKHLEDAIGVTKETAIAMKLEAAAEQAPAPAEPVGTPVEVTFSLPKWGMTTRMSGGPVVVRQLRHYYTAPFSKRFSSSMPHHMRRVTHVVAINWAI